MYEQLEKNWFCLATQFTTIKSAQKAFLLLKQQYTGSSRHYHNFEHLNAMFKGLELSESKINKIEIIQFAIWFHDVVYNAYKKNNEVRSAKKATNFLNTSSFAKEKTQKVVLFIEATAKHELLIHNNDLALFLDLDLSILGSERSVYQSYTKKIRKEYQLIPAFMYKKGRKAVLQHFMSRKNLYFTPEFQEKLEEQARENIAWEIDSLN